MILDRPEQYEDLTDELEEHVQNLRFNVSMRRYTTMRVGGNADIFGYIESAESLAAVRRILAEAGVPLTMLGLGSNTIVHDDGVRGVVVRLRGDLTGVYLPSEDGPAPEPGTSVLAEIGAGTVNAHAVRDMHNLGLIGAEFLALVPGTLGGAVVMNAGTRWGELSDVLHAVEVIDDTGLRWISAEDLEMSYRHCELPKNSVVTRARVELEYGDAATAERKVRDEKAYREATQPYKLATSGSIFTNPPGDFAGRLIEAVGFKGKQIGEAVISPKHANWIVNLGSARAEHVLELMADARRQVYESFGIWLTTEVRLLGGSGSIVTELAAIDEERRNGSA